MSNQAVVVFVEGDTEEEFYKKVISFIRKKQGNKLNCLVKCINMKGIGNYKRKVGGVFEKRIKHNYADCESHVLLSYDTDVFGISKNPPVVWTDVREMLLEKGAASVSFIKAKECIEDWFLRDQESILTYLSLPMSTKVKGENGLKKLENLFKKKNKLYIKGEKSSGLVEQLNIQKILGEICEDIRPLCKQLGMDCKNSSKCKTAPELQKFMCK